MVLSILKDFLSVKVQAFKVQDHDKIVIKTSKTGHCQIFDKVSGGDQHYVEQSQIKQTALSPESTSIVMDIAKKSMDDKRTSQQIIDQIKEVLSCRDGENLVAPGWFPTGMDTTTFPARDSSKWKRQGIKRCGH